jgi:fatty-acid desaturase
MGPAADGIPPARGGRKQRQPTTGKPDDQKVHSMLYTIAVILLVLWLLGLVTSYTMGGFIHILLVFAVVMVLVNLISGRRAL